ncbi:MAG: type II toxin-antitoxin system VapC family toxin [Candidatus Binatia bacterium]
MSAAAVRKYVLDTNLFIRGFRDPAANVELQRFHLLFAPFEYLSSVVAQELIAGTRTVPDQHALERNVLGVYKRRGRVVTPSGRAWEQSGEVLAELVRNEGLEIGRVSKALGNDILLALSCREAGLVLITDNDRDFARIAAIVRFRFVGPWPVPAHG